MIRFGGLDGVLVAAEALKGLVEDARPPMRIQAARVLGAIGVRNFYQPVLQLMADPELVVRREAIGAAGVLRGPEFVLPLLYRSQARETMQEALQALTAYGPSIIPTLAKALGNPNEDTAVRRSVARVLGRLSLSEAVEVIARHLDEPDEDLRGILYRALARGVKGKRLLLKDSAPVRAALDRELQRAWRALHHAELLELAPGPTAMAELRTRARAEPRNTEARELPEPAKERVASCVLSPSSATKTAAKVVPTSFQSMDPPPEHERALQFQAGQPAAA